MMFIILFVGATLIAVLLTFITCYAENWSDKREQLKNQNKQVEDWVKLYSGFLSQINYPNFDIRASSIRDLVFIEVETSIYADNKPTRLVLLLHKSMSREEVVESARLLIQTLELKKFQHTFTLAASEPNHK
jgi:hypothetical protein